MGERKGTNKWYPPDWHPDHGNLNKYWGTHALRERARKIDQGIIIIRFEMPYNIWCEGCGNHIGMGVRYNAEKKKAGSYYSTTIWQFRMKCHLCDNHFEIKTDPANLDYVIVSGARRQEKRFDPRENGQVVPEDRDTIKKLATDAMFKLEHVDKDKTKGKEAKTSLAHLEYFQEERWKDDYAANRAMRNKFRESKKELLKGESADKELLQRTSLDLPLLPETDEDRRTAHLLVNTRKETYEEMERKKIEAIRRQSVFARKKRESAEQTVAKKVLKESILNGMRSRQSGTNGGPSSSVIAGSVSKKRSSVGIVIRPTRPTSEASSSLASPCTEPSEEEQEVTEAKDGSAVACEASNGSSPPKLPSLSALVDYGSGDSGSSDGDSSWLNMDRAVKLKNVLSSLQEPGNVVKDDALIDKLCTTIEKEIDPAFVSTQDFIIDFIRSTLHCGETPSSWRHRDLFKISFALLKVAFKDESCLSSLLQRVNFFNLVHSLINSPDFADPIVRICCLQFIASCLESSKKDWIASSGAWLSCVMECINHPSIFVAREARRVGVAILVNADSPASSLLAQEMFKIFESSSPVEGSEEEVLLSFSGLLCTALESLLKDGENHRKVPWLTKENLSSLMLSVENKIVKSEASGSTLLVRLQILSIYIRAHDVLIGKEGEDKKILSSEFLSRVSELMNWNCFSVRHELLAPIAAAAHQAWYLMKGCAGESMEDDGQAQLFLVSAQIVPILAYLFRFHISCLDGIYRNIVTRLDKNDPVFRDIVNDLRKNMKDVQSVKLTQLAIQAAHGLKGVVHLFSKENAICALQAATIIIVIQGYVCNPASQQLQIAAIDLLSLLLSFYQYTLSDSYESVCLIYMLCYLCDRPDISTKVIIKGYRLLQQAMNTNAMPLEIALSHSETSSKTFSSHYLARSLKSRANNRDWELRDSVLETLTAFVEASGSSCIPLRAWLAEHKMLNLAIDALEDPESYVRASGYKLLGAAVRVPEVWEGFEKEHGKFVDNATGLILTNGEAFCRREAVNYLIRLCECGRIQVESPEFSLICATITQLCSADLDWESKRNALDFWHWCARNELRRVGIIDGVLPATIFDSHLNRIIDTTPEVGAEKVTSCLESLCHYGCMDCLLEAAQDLEMSVREKANVILDELVQVLESFNLLSKTSGIEDEKMENMGDGEAKGVNSDSADANGHDGSDRDAVIEALLDGSDAEAVWERMTLPLGAYSGVKPKNLGSTGSIPSKSPRFNYRSCLEEISRLKESKNALKLLNDVESPLDSYLDDILINFGVQVTNPHPDVDDVPMDCY